MTTIRNWNSPGSDALSMNSVNIEGVGDTEGLNEANLMLQDLVSFNGAGASPLLAGANGTGTLNSPLTHPGFAKLLSQLGIDANSPSVASQLRNHNAENSVRGRSPADYISDAANQLHDDALGEFQDNQQLQAFMDMSRRINTLFTAISKLYKEADKTKGSISSNIK